MGRKKKIISQTQHVELSTSDKLYIDLSLKTQNNVNYDEMFKRIALELDKDENIIRDYANKLTPLLRDEQLPPEPKPQVLKPDQEQLRNIITPNRLSETNKARHITIMSDVVSSTIEKMPPSVIKGSSKTSGCIFRQ